MIREMRTAPWTAYAALCASILWSGLMFIWHVPHPGNEWIRWVLTPAVVGALITPWSTLRREGIAMIAGAVVIAATYFAVLIVGGGTAFIAAAILS